MRNVPVAINPSKMRQIEKKKVPPYTALQWLCGCTTTSLLLEPGVLELSNSVSYNLNEHSMWINTSTVY